MNIRALPARVARHGGAVMTFEDTRAAYKRVRIPGTDTETICRLAILPGSRIVYPHSESGSWNNNKLRAEAAHVHEIEGPATEAVSIVDGEFVYREGETVSPDEFDPDTATVCAPGIHCFATRTGAEFWRNAGGTNGVPVPGMGP